MGKSIVYVKVADGSVARTEMLQGDIFMDKDKDGSVLGVEFLDVISITQESTPGSSVEEGE